MQTTPLNDRAEPSLVADASEEPEIQSLIATWSLAQLVEQTERLAAQGLAEQACVAYQLWL